MQHHIRRTALVASVLVIAAALGACGGGPRRVSGQLDSTRHVPEATRLAHRPHLVRHCRSGSKRVRHTSGSGSRKRTWYTDEPTTVCAKEQQGTETYRQVVHQERWCVSLDDVDGKESRDDVWYRVSRSTYQNALQLKAGSRLSFEPDHDGC